jgi:hypothetical protein
MVYDINYCHKSRLVAGGHLTDLNTDSVYSGVVSLRGIRLVHSSHSSITWSYGVQM